MKLVLRALAAAPQNVLLAAAVISLVLIPLSGFAVAPIVLSAMSIACLVFSTRAYINEVLKKELTENSAEK